MHEAFNQPKWNIAIMEEIRALEKEKKEEKFQTCPKIKI
uniref:Uncharacterized protein n=1 Tax=Rhizophora mucronata TaxID=61149 RepID=A0A2P2N2V6_RHIMU